MGNTTEEVASSFVTALDKAAKGGAEDPYLFLDDAVEVELIGKTPISGIYRGVDEVKGILVSTLRHRLNSFSVELIEIIAEDNDAAILATVTAAGKAEMSYNPNGDPAGAFFTVEKGKIRKITFFPDTMDIQEALFGQVMA